MDLLAGNDLSSFFFRLLGVYYVAFVWEGFARMNSWREVGELLVDFLSTGDLSARLGFAVEGYRHSQTMGLVPG